MEQVIIRGECDGSKYLGTYEGKREGVSLIKAAHLSLPSLHLHLELFPLAAQTRADP